MLWQLLSRISALSVGTALAWEEENPAKESKQATAAQSKKDGYENSKQLWRSVTH